jgi:hypothetical protein
MIHVTNQTVRTMSRSSGSQGEASHDNDGKTTSCVFHLPDKVEQDLIAQDTEQPLVYRLVMLLVSVPHVAVFAHLRRLSVSGCRFMSIHCHL